ncbi:flavoprotein [Spirillospora sp. NPDC000708]|uniref:flavoprotein n=1 Tax=Actinomadura TaxID=1988 RepID=UPI001682FAF7|nr:Coenzyme A biosynthesis bifunctional protein CoaBC [Actinomadura sp. RB99]
MPARPVLYVIACGGRPAAELPSFVERLLGDGWTVCAVATPAATRFVDAARLSELTGLPVRSDYKRPEEPDVLPPADAFAVVPATFNTVNKWAHGISDTLALGLLNEAVGQGRPIVAAPWPNAALARHPVFSRSVAELRAWGVTVLLDTDRLPNPDSDEPSGATFPWADLRDHLRSLRARLTEG